MPLIGEPFFPRPRDSHGFVQFGIILSLSAVHQWAQDTLFLGPLPPPKRWKSRNRPALVWSRSAKPARADPQPPHRRSDAPREHSPARRPHVLDDYAFLLRR